MRSGKLIAIKDDLVEQFVQDDNYIINEDGTILTRITIAGNVGSKNNWRELKAQITRSGSVRVRYKNTHLKLSRIIYRALVGKLERDKIINHIDGNPKNNHFSNLELITQGENNLHRFKNPKNLPNMGAAKITFPVAEQIREEHKRGLSYKQLTAKYFISKSSISYIINKKTWTNPDHTGIKTFPSIEAYWTCSPPWVNVDELMKIYKNKPKGMTVDHIIPINNSCICGLHVPWNLQYLSLSENGKKGNSFDGTNENESWKTKE